jgi:uncharacterized membrane protein
MKKLISLASLYLFVVGLVLSANIQGILYNCFNAVDFGIYLQGIYGITMGDFNPYLTVRDLKLFTDHFDPINFLPALLMKLTVTHPVVLMTFEWAVVLSLSIIIFVMARKRFNLHYSLFLAAIVFINKPMLISLRFPVHPTTWSIIPLFFLSFFLLRDSFKGVFVSCLTLLFFKESYPFAIFSLSFYYIILKRHREFLTLFLTSILSYILIFKIRPMFLGESYNYSSLLFSRANQGYFQFALLVIKEFKYFDLFKNFLPFWLTLGLFLSLEKNKLKLSHPCVGLGFFIAPLFLMQFIANRFDFHYGSTFVALLLPFFFENSIYEFGLKKSKFALLFMAIFLFNAGSEIEKMIGQVFFHKNRHCVISDEKKQSVQNLLQETNSLRSENHVVMTGGVFNRVLRPGLKMYQIGGYSAIPSSFDTLLLEIHPKEQSWPLSPEEIQKFYQKCKLYSAEVLLEDQFFYFAKGNYPKSCLQ